MQVRHNKTIHKFGHFYSFMWDWRWFGLGFEFMNHTEYGRFYYFHFLFFRFEMHDDDY